MGKLALLSRNCECLKLPDIMHKRGVYGLCNEKVQATSSPDPLPRIFKFNVDEAIVLKIGIVLQIIQGDESNRIANRRIFSTFL